MPNAASKLCSLVFVAFFLQGNIQAQPGRIENGIMVCNSRMGNLELQWCEVKNVKSSKLPFGKGTSKLPLKYVVYTVSDPALRQYMMSLKVKPGNIALPLGSQACIEAYVSNSGVMSAGLAAKFPQLVSLKGYGVNDGSSSVRLDYDGATLNGEIISGGISYIIEPWKKGAVTYYLVFRKEDKRVDRKQQLKEKK